MGVLEIVSILFETIFKLFDSPEKALEVAAAILTSQTVKVVIYSLLFIIFGLVTLVFLKLKYKLEFKCIDQLLMALFFAPFYFLFGVLFSGIIKVSNVLFLETGISTFAEEAYSVISGMFF